HCPSSQEALRRLRIMLDYIHEHFNQPFSLTGLANHTLLSRESCCRIFKQMTGMTISQYMTEYRVMRSLPYLADGKYSIAEVSALCGFSSQSRFAAAFRSKMGCNPNQYLHSNFDIIRNS
ncbi:helix-turn-helix transcriptional regulator, partial [Enterocloster sp.]